MSNSSRDDYQTLVLASDPIGYWPLRENADDKCNHAHHDGDCHGEPEFISDATGGWVRLDGRSYIEVPSERPTLYENSPDWSIYPSAGNAPLRFGTRSDPAHCLVGGLAEIAVYQRVLDESEIKGHYQAGSKCFVQDSR